MNAQGPENLARWIRTFYMSTRRERLHYKELVFMIERNEPHPFKSLGISRKSGPRSLDGVVLCYLKALRRQGRMVSLGDGTWMALGDWHKKP